MKPAPRGPFGRNTEMRFRLLVTVTALALSFAAAHAKDDYVLGPDSMEQPGVPRGEITKMVWKSEVFPKTVRDVWVYVPAQYKETEPACVMVFQDGVRFYASPKGQFCVPTVLDNLIHK